MGIKEIMLQDIENAARRLTRLAGGIRKLPNDHPAILAAGDRLENGDDDGDEYRDALAFHIRRYDGTGAESFLDGLLQRFDDMDRPAGKLFDER